MTEFEIFGGQNKNYTVIRFLHWLVHGLKRFEKAKIIFPIRGHSYLECDKNMGLINQKANIDLPREWWAVFKSARQSPTPFVVIECKRDMFLQFTNFLKPGFKPKCPIPTRPIRELVTNKSHPTYVSFRDSFNGTYETGVITSNTRLPLSISAIKQSYPGPVAIKKAKYDDLQVLKRFCVPNARPFYDNLLYIGGGSNGPAGEANHDDTDDYLEDN